MNPVGLKVLWTVDNFTGNGVVIGVMSYSPDVWCVATENTHGMTINRHHCKFGDQRDDELAAQLRARYIDLYGERFVA